MNSTLARAAIAFGVIMFVAGVLTGLLISLTITAVA